jgi:hypothetical protein
MTGATDLNGERLLAPTDLGPANWAVTIRLHQNCRDTTFAVRVPYRVAPR